MTLTPLETRTEYVVQWQELGPSAIWQDNMSSMSLEMAKSWRDNLLSQMWARGNSRIIQRVIAESVVED